MSNNLQFMDDLDTKYIFLIRNFLSIELRKT